jgi:hypothetical protein
MEVLTTRNRSPPCPGTFRTNDDQHTTTMKIASYLSTRAVVALTVLSSLSAQAQSFDVGDNVLNLGIGLGGYRYSYLSSYNNGVTVTPTLCASYERGVSELGPGVLGISGFFARKSVRYQDHVSQSWSGWAYDYDRRWSNTIIGLRGSWHYNEWHGSDRFDIYGGLMLGYNIGSYKNKSTRTRNGVTETYDDDFNYSLSFVTYSTYLGMRYLFTDNIGAYLELGYGISYLNLGAPIKF